MGLSEKDVRDFVNSLKIIKESTKKKLEWGGMHLDDTKKSALLRYLSDEDITDLFAIGKKEVQTKKRIQKNKIILPHDTKGKNITLSSAPFKSFLKNQIKREHDPFSPLFELIDNSLDAIIESEDRTKDYEIILIFEKDSESGSTSLTVKDNGGGMDKEKIEALITPGRTSHNFDQSKQIIGTWGQAFTISVYQLGEETTIITSKRKQHEDEEIKSYEIPMTQDYLDSDDWIIHAKELPYDLGGITQIEIKNLRHFIEGTREMYTQLIGLINLYFSNLLYKLTNGDQAKKISLKILSIEGDEYEINAYQLNYSKIFSFSPIFVPIQLQNLRLYAKNE